jgi:hypothetical protein
MFKPVAWASSTKVRVDPSPAEMAAMATIDTRPTSPMQELKASRAKRLEKTWLKTRLT